MAPNNPSIRDLITIVESAENKLNTYDPDPCVHCGSDEVTYNDLVTDASCASCGKWQADPIEEEESREKLLYPPTVYDGEGNEHPYDIYYDVMANKKVGDTVSSEAAAPGYGGTVDRITRMDDTGVYGVQIKNTVQIMEPWMVEDNTNKTNICPDCLGTGDDELTGPGYECERCDGEGSIFEDETDKTSICPDCEGTGDRLTGSDHLFPGMSYECERCNSTGSVFESETRKQREEPVRDDPYCRNCSAMRPDECVCEQVEEGEKPYAGKGGEPYATMTDGPDKYLFRKDGKQKLVGSDDNEPEDGEEELEETDMDKELREMQIAAGIIKEGQCQHCGEDHLPQDCDLHDKADKENEEAVEEGALPDALKKHQFGAKNDDVDKSDDKDDDKDDDKEEVDEDIINWMKRFDKLSTPVNEETDDDSRPGLGRDGCQYCGEVDCDYDCDESQAGGFDESVNEDCPTDEDKNADGECSPLTHVELDEDDFEEDLLLAPEGPKGPAVDEDDMVYGEPGRGKSYGPKDFDKFGGEVLSAGQHSDDSSAMECPSCKDIALVSKGITGDLEEFECDSCGNYQTMPPMTEHSPGEFDHDPDAMIDVGDKEDFEVYDFDNEFETMLGGSSDPVDNFGAGSMYEMNEIRKLAGLEPIEEEKADKDNDDDKVESEEEVTEGFPGSEFPDSDVVAYDIADERAYYLMADILGAELDFGPQDEILVPAERNDEICAELTKQGFEQGRDFKVAGQMMDDLQNGYNDRAFTKGQDYFPKGAQSTPATDLGPTASGLRDNPMANKMRMVKKDEVYENMKLAYRRHRKND